MKFGHDNEREPDWRYSGFRYLRVNRSSPLLWPGTRGGSRPRFPFKIAEQVSHNDKTSAQGTDQSVFESQPAQSKVSWQLQRAVTGFGYGMRDCENVREKFQAEIGYGRNAAASDQAPGPVCSQNTNPKP